MVSTDFLALLQSLLKFYRTLIVRFQNNPFHLRSDQLLPIGPTRPQCTLHQLLRCAF